MHSKLSYNTQEHEIRLLMDAILEKYGYDLRHYTPSLIQRRLRNRLKILKLNYISELIPLTLHDINILRTIILDMSITVTDMFRNPDSFQAIQTLVIPKLKTYPFIKIWHAGCATGQEVYSMAILLKEAGCLDRTQIYATDINHESLDIAAEGIYPSDNYEKYHKNYSSLCKQDHFKEYFSVKNKKMIVNNELRKKILFSYHNLITDSNFGEMNLIFCRNVLIYFDHSLQKKALNLFHNSLEKFGYLCIGNKESLPNHKGPEKFKAVSSKQRIFQKNI